MKFLVLLFLVGYASASFYDALDDAADEFVHDFMVGMEHAPSLKEALGLPLDHAYADEVDNEIKTELGRRLKDAVDKILKKIKDAVEKGHTVRDELFDKLKELKEKLKEVKGDLSDKAKDLVKQIKEHAKNFLRKLLEKLGDEQKRSVEEYEIEAAFADFNIRRIFKNLKDAILKKIDKEKLKELIEKLFGKGNELADSLLVMLKEKGDIGKQKILDMIDRFLGEKETEEKRSIKDLWEKVKDYFDNLKIDIKEKYLKFGEWVKETVKKGLDHSKTKLENIKTIAREFIDHSKEVSKDVAVEALEFLRPYKEDMKELWEKTKIAVKDVLNRKD